MESIHPPRVRPKKIDIPRFRRSVTLRAAEICSRVGTGLVAEMGIQFHGAHPYGSQAIVDFSESGHVFASIASTMRSDTKTKWGAELKALKDLDRLLRDNVEEHVAYLISVLKAERVSTPFRIDEAGVLLLAKDAQAKEDRSSELVKRSRAVHALKEEVGRFSRDTGLVPDDVNAIIAIALDGAPTATISFVHRGGSARATFRAGESLGTFLEATTLATKTMREILRTRR